MHPSCPCASTHANPAGRVTGGFADVYLDFDGDGTRDALVGDDVFIVANHSFEPNLAQGEPSVLPPIIDGN